jgi:hypothetical protein
VLAQFAAGISADQDNDAGSDFGCGRLPDSTCLIAIKKLSPRLHAMQE